MFTLYFKQRDPYQIENCVRVLHHDNDSGGFFLAVLLKTAVIEDETETQVKLNETKERTIKQDLEELDSVSSNSVRSDDSVDLFPQVVPLREYPGHEELIDYFGIKRETFVDSLFTSRHTSKKVKVAGNAVVEVVNKLLKLEVTVKAFGQKAFEFSRCKRKSCKVCK